jgi:TatD DNase family protein
MEIKYFDIHSHLDYPDYASDFEAIINRMTENNIGTITVGTDLNSAKQAIKLSDKYENVWVCIGIHPADNHAETWNEEEFEKLVAHSKVVAIGECGFDFFRPEINSATGEIDQEKFLAEKKRQQELFEKQIQFAIRHDKTLMIHCRDAYNETYEILAKYKIGEFKDKNFTTSKTDNVITSNCSGSNLRIHLHFYAGDIEMTKKFLKLDCTFSFTGVITFARNYDEVIKFLPLKKIMSETDAPFVAPAPYRGKRNEPAYVLEVIKKIAEIKGLNQLEVENQLLENAKNIFLRSNYPTN